MTQHVDELLAGRTDFSWLLFEYVRPIIRDYVGHRKINTIESIYPDKAQREALVFQIAQHLDDFLKSGNSILWDAHDLNQHKMLPRKKQGISHFEKHCTGTIGEFHNTFVEHLEELLRVNNRLDEITEEQTTVTLREIVRADPTRTGARLEDPAHIGLRHGSFALNGTPITSPIILEVTRIKYLERAAKKFARYICEGIDEHRILREFLSNNKTLELKNKDKILETLGAMHSHGLAVPFTEETEYLHIPQITEYLLMRARVRDIFGKIEVTTSRQAAENLVTSMIKGQHKLSHKYRVIEGQVLVWKQGKFTYERRPLVDRHLDKRPHNKNNSIFVYIEPTEQPTTIFKHIADVGVYGSRDYAIDAPGGVGNHLAYQARQENDRTGWRRDRSLEQLETAILNAILPIVRRINTYTYPLYLIS